MGGRWHVPWGKEPGPGGLSVGILESHGLALTVEVCLHAKSHAPLGVKPRTSLFCGNYIPASFQLGCSVLLGRERASVAKAELLRDKFAD